MDTATEVDMRAGATDDFIRFAALLRKLRNGRFDLDTIFHGIGFIKAQIYQATSVIYQASLCEIGGMMYVAVGSHDAASL